MKQYCRYCIHLWAGNGIWCDAKQQEIRESTAKKTVNTCKQFEFCEIDAFAETDGYKPRKPRMPVVDDIGENQIKLEVE